MAPLDYVGLEAQGGARILGVPISPSGVRQRRWFKEAVGLMSEVTFRDWGFSLSLAWSNIPSISIFSIFRFKFNSTSISSYLQI